MPQTEIDYGSIGKKMYYTISEVCRLTDLKDSVLRHWETEIPKLRPKKSRGGNRAYQTKDIELIMRVKQLVKDEGLSLQSVRQRISEERSEARASKGRAVDTASPVQTASVAELATPAETVSAAGGRPSAAAEPETEVLQIELPLGLEPPEEQVPPSPASAAPPAGLLSEIREGLEDILRLLGR